jgi:hypothetical protein
MGDNSEHEAKLISGTGAPAPAMAALIEKFCRLIVAAVQRERQTSQVLPVRPIRGR